MLKTDPRLVSQDGDLLKNKAQELAYQLDPTIIGLLLKNDLTKSRFFKEIEGCLIFDQHAFVSFVMNKEFLPDSYTSYKNKIGLTIDGKTLDERKEVSLVWAYKDCVLAWGQDKEDSKRDEIFYNETLGSDQIDRLLDPKVFTGFKRIDTDGKHDLESFRKDENGNITDNLIIKWNNLLALHSLKKQFKGKVKLIYIDPPYNTWEDWFNYNDSFNRSTWLTFMKNRLSVAKDLLHSQWSIYVNIDYNEVHYLKILMDEVFGKDSFQREIIWRIGWLSGYKTIAKNYIRNHDTILFYTKSKDDFTFNKAYIPREEFMERFNADNKKEISSYLKDALDIQERKKQTDFIDFISNIGLPEQYPIEDTWNCSTYDKLNSIAIVSFAWEKVSKMLWTDELKWQKSEKLLQRIIEISTNPWDIVLDYHLWTWSTWAVSHKLWRQYVWVEQMNYIETMAVERLKKVINWDNVGISNSINWQGGWDFVYMEIACDAERYIEMIRDAQNTHMLLDIWAELKTKSFVNHKLDPKSIDNTLEVFKTLGFSDQQKTLISLIDKNALYKNLSEMDDTTSEVSESDKKLNRDFYNQ